MGIAGYDVLWNIEWTKENATNNRLPLDYKIKNHKHRPASIKYLIPVGSFTNPGDSRPDIIQVLDSLGQVIQHDLIGGDGGYKKQG